MVRRLYEDKDYVQKLYEKSVDDIATELGWMFRFLDGNPDDEHNINSTLFITQMRKIRDYIKERHAFIHVYRDWLNQHEEREQLANEKMKIVNDLASAKETIKKIKQLFSEQTCTETFNSMAQMYNEDLTAAFNALCATKQEKARASK